MSRHHQSLLAFGYTYSDEDTDESSYRTVNAHDLEHFHVLTRRYRDVELLDVHHVDASDDSRITAVIWTKENNPNPRPYTDVWANNSWVFSDMDRIAHGE